jgi:uncharacterized protein YutE (UPF0331/DUF86 family)
MTQSSQLLERDVLALLAANYEERGYHFITYPPPGLLPEFLEGYRPDAIAVGTNDNIVIEVKSAGETPGQKLDEIASLVSAHPGWRFLVYYAGNALQSTGPIETLETPRLVDGLSEVKSLKDAGQFRAAFVLAWALLEAVFRTVEFDQGKLETKPQTPGRVVEQLEMLGMLTDVEATRLRELVQIRNRIVHGAVTMRDLSSELDFMIPLLGKLIETVAPAPRPISDR